jgi:hypothetical protein
VTILKESPSGVPVEVSGGASNTDDVLNLSGVPGISATDALDQLASDIAGVVAGLAGLDSDDVANVSDVDGADVTEALNRLGLGTLLRGPDISGTVDSSLEREDGCLFVFLAATTTGARVVTLATTGTVAPAFPFNFVIVHQAQVHAVTYNNGGPAGAVAGSTTVTIAAGQRRLIYFQFDGLNFFLADVGDLAA